MNSRWLETPGHVTEREGDLPGGFRMAGVAFAVPILTIPESRRSAPPRWSTP